VTGILLSAGVARLVQAAFVGVDVLHPLTYIVVALVQCIVVVLACISPAVRASRVDPLVALRTD
jgi:putative ABC transport system permease protein